MPKVFPFYHPFMLPNGDQEALAQRRVEYDSAAAAAAQYQVNDLITVASGKALKEIGTTPANLGPLALSGHDWKQPFAVTDKRGSDPSYFLDNLFANIIRDDSLFVFSYQGAAANGANHVYTQGELDALNAGAKRELIYNTTEGCLTIRNTSTNPNVELLELFNGAAVGDSNVPIVCKILPAFLLG